VSFDSSSAPVVFLFAAASFLAYFSAFTASRWRFFSSGVMLAPASLSSLAFSAFSAFSLATF
jgi:hypothetical protein